MEFGEFLTFDVAWARVFSQRVSNLVKCVYYIFFKKNTVPLEVPFLQILINSDSRNSPRVKMNLFYDQEFHWKKKIGNTYCVIDALVWVYATQKTYSYDMALLESQWTEYVRFISRLVLLSLNQDNYN